MTHESSHSRARVAEVRPKLRERADANRRNRKEPNPFDRDDTAKAEPNTGEPQPPIPAERRLFLVRIAKSNPGECCEGGVKDELGIEEDIARLSEERILEKDHHRAYDGSCCA